MSTVQVLLGKSQGTAKTFPKFTPDKLFETKASSQDPKKGVFRFYDKNEEDKDKRVKEYAFPIKGILIGVANQGEAYCSSLGSKGGTFMTSMYLRNDNMVLFGGGNKVCEGDISTIEAYLSSQGAERLSKKQVYFVLVKDKYNGGIVIAVKTNMSIAIDHMNKYGKELKSKMIHLTPKVYEQGSGDVSEKALKHLGALIKRNPPAYANVTVGEEITMDMLNELGGVGVINDFVKWKEFILDGGKENVEETIEKQKTEVDDILKNDDGQYDEGSDELAF